MAKYTHEIYPVGYAIVEEADGSLRGLSREEFEASVGAQYAAALAKSLMEVQQVSLSPAVLKGFLGG